MKLTWFGATALRVYIGGRIVVIDADASAARVDRRELVAGADRVLALEGKVARPVDPQRWRPPVARPLAPQPELEVLTIGPATLLISAPGEPPLLVADVAELPQLGRWADGAVFILFGERGVRLAGAIVAHGLAHPRLLALAAAGPVLDALFEDGSQRHDGSNGPSLSALEPGLALEV